MGQTFKPGEVVDVTIKGVRYNHHDTASGEHEILVDGARYQLPARAVVDRVAPPEWPPQAGDIWTNPLGYEWLGRANGELYGVDTGGGGSCTDINRKHGPLTLARRRGWTPQSTTQDEPEPDVRAARIAGLRAFADLLETRTDLPAPYAINGQIGFCGEDGLAKALQLAASLGIDLEPARDTHHEVQRWARSGKLDLGGDVTLTLYAHGLDAPELAEAVPEGGVAS